MAVACGGVGLFILCSWEAGERERKRERERERERERKREREREKKRDQIKATHLKQ
jgi:hypothetical protein